MTPKRYHRIVDVLNRRQPDLTIVAEEVFKERNLAAMIRSCDAVGVDLVHCVSPSKPYQSFRGTSASSDKWVEVRNYSHVDEPIRQLKREGFQVLAAHLSHDAVDFREVDYTRPSAILFGEEVEGISASAEKSVDQCITIPMMGMVESFNVSVACAIILMEAQRQREIAGFYDQSRLPASRYRELAFRWAHPKLARICDQRGAAYPTLDFDGDIVDIGQWRKSLYEGRQELVDP